MRIILATYNYYPWHWGGSEIYVHGLAKFLTEEGFEVLVVAAVSEKALENNTPVFEDDFMQVILYDYEGIKVAGCITHVSKTEIYSRNNPIWKTSWMRFFEKNYKGEAPVLLHLHANTPLISVAFVEAVKELYPKIKTLFSYHVPVSCPKGTLLYFNEKACTIKPDVSLCTACVYQDRLGVSKGLAKILSMVSPNLALPEKLPATMQLKYLYSLTIKAFDKFSAHIDRWLVFSHQIENALKTNGADPEKMTVIRHGIDDRYIAAAMAVNQEMRPSNMTVFFFVGRYKKLKGVHTLLKAWMGLPESPERRLWLAGGDPDIEPEVSEQLEKAKTRSDIEFLGTLKVEEILAHLQRSHCMVIPSECVEIGPFVLHEAVCCGANVLASDEGGCAELAAFYGEGCTTFRMGDDEDLKRAILGFSFVPIQKKVQGQREHYSLVLEEYKMLIDGVTSSHAVNFQS